MIALGDVGLPDTGGHTWLVTAATGACSGVDGANGARSCKPVRRYALLHRQAHEVPFDEAVMVNIELQSRLTLHGPQAPSKPTIPMSQPMVNALSTPVTTPQAMITSPDQTAGLTGTTSMAVNAQTPPDLSTDTGGEVDAYLSDPLNEAWAMTFGFGLNQTRNSLEIRPAMASGLLLKRVARQD
ncbi:MAG: hypothetical protein EON54_18760, partial [Alcaligenaceae bacterium]